MAGLALGGDAADFFHIRIMAVEITQVEAIDVTLGNAHGPDPLGRLRGGHFFVVIDVGRRLELGFAPVPLDAVAIKHPEGGPRKQPAQHHQVAADRFQKKPAGVLGVQVVEVRNHRHVEPRLHDQGGDDRFFQRTLGGMLALRLRQDNLTVKR